MTPNHAPDQPPVEADSTTAVVPLRRNGDYLKWFVSDVAADAGNAIRAFAMPLIALAITGSLTLSGVIAAASSFTAVLFIVPGGIAADRFDRRKLLLVGHAIGAIVWTVGIALFFAGWLNTATLFGLGILTGFRSGFFGSVSTPALRQLVQPAQLPQALAANQGRDGVIQLVSGPVGGFLVALSVWAPFAAQAIGHALAWVSVHLIRADLRPNAEPDTGAEPLAEGEAVKDGEPRAEGRRAARAEEAPNGEEAPSVKQQIGAGFRWLSEHRTVTTLLALAAVLSFATSGGVQSVVLWLADTGEDETRIGFVSAAVAVGMIAGSAIAGPIANRFPTGKLSVLAILYMAAVLSLLTVVRDFETLLVVLALACVALPIFNSGASGWALAQIPDAKMGAISSAAGLLNSALMPLAPLFAGIGLDVFGYNVTIIFFVVIIIAGAIGMALVRDFRNLGTPEQWTVSAL